MTSDTPRTDKALLTYTGGEYVTFPRGLRCVVDADFARQLERELAAVTAERDALRKRVVDAHDQMTRLVPRLFAAEEAKERAEAREAKHIETIRYMVTTMREAYPGIDEQAPPEHVTRRVCKALLAAEAALRECLQHADALSDSLIFEVEARYGNGIKVSEVKAYRAWRAGR